MRGRGLFWKLKNAGKSAARTVDPVDSILEHLRALLNTRKGDSASAPDFGVHSFIDLVHNFPGAAQILLRSIKATVLAFEPRLKNVNVRHVPEEDPLLLRYEISGQLADATDRRTLRFNTQISAGGRTKVW
jgi:type VI secretion system protein